MSKLQLYPRGFLGSRLGERIEKSGDGRQADSGGFILSAMQATFQLQSTGEGEKLVGNPDVDKLWKPYISQARNTMGNEFEDRVFLCALSAFGTHSFMKWVYSQQASPSYGFMHRDFIDDTLRFIMTGERHMAITAWMSLVEHNDSGDYRSAAPSEMMQKFLKYENFKYPPNSDDFSDLKLPAVIAAWISHENGFSDMMASLHILFGTP